MAYSNEHGGSSTQIEHSSQAFQKHQLRSSSSVRRSGNTCCLYELTYSQSATDYLGAIYKELDPRPTSRGSCKQEQGATGESSYSVAVSRVKSSVYETNYLIIQLLLISRSIVSRTSVLSRLQDLQTYTALVDCLCNFLDEHVEETTKTVSHILPKTRPLGERKALRVAALIVSEDVPAALDAGIVSRWLCKYPFPCALANPSRRQDVVLLMKTYWSDDPLMSSLIGVIASHPDGVRQLRKYDLMGSMIAENDQDDDDDDLESDVWMIDGDETAGTRRPSERRLPEESPEEQALRRRRREAMVLSEGGRPLGTENIIQPVMESM